MWKNFNPHAPHGGATIRPQALLRFRLISIHTPRMGARRNVGATAAAHRIFQSTRPAWGRDEEMIAPRRGCSLFQSTRPAWGRDVHSFYGSLIRLISIHTPRMGARRGFIISSINSEAFQSTRPAWGRDNGLPLSLATSIYFNPHAPHGGATGYC